MTRLLPHTQELCSASERVFTLESERAHLQPQLTRARDLELEVRDEPLGLPCRWWYRVILLVF